MNPNSHPLHRLTHAFEQLRQPINQFTHPTIQFTPGIIQFTPLLDQLRHPCAGRTGLSSLAVVILSLVAVAVARPGMADPPQLPVALVTKVAGPVHLVAGAQDLPAVDFVQVVANESFTVLAGGTIDLVYFGDGRRERWTGPARFVVRAAGATALAGSAAVSWLPAAAVAALRQVPPRGTASAAARAGAARLRAPDLSQPPAPPAAPLPPFDEGAARAALQRHGRDDLARDRPPTPQPAVAAVDLAQATTLSALTARIEGPAVAGLEAVVRAAGFALAATNVPPAQVDVLLKTLPNGQVAAQAVGGTQWQAVAGEARTKMLLGVARSVQLERLLRADAGQLVAVALAVVPVGSAGVDGAGGPLRVTSGQQIAFEVANDSPVPLNYTLLEQGPTGAISAFWPPAGKTAALQPFERSRVGLVFAAMPPLGGYRYFLVATATSARPSGQALAVGVHPDVAAWVTALVTGPTPAAAAQVQRGQRWGVALATLVIEP